MPRQARRKSESGIYHIMLRGINRQVIFEDEEDNFRLTDDEARKIIHKISRCSTIAEFQG